MFFYRQSLARKPSLSTIDSVDTNKRTLSPPLPDSDRKDIFISSERRSLSYPRPYVPSPATVNQAWVPPAMEQNMAPPSRPPLVRVPTTETKYMQMLLHLDRIPRVYNFLAGVFTWILLASFLIIPGTFTSFKNSDIFKNIQDDQDKSNAVAKAIIGSAANVGLLWLSGAFCIIGGTGCLFLWFRWRNNYVWIVNKVFLPATLNAVAGLLTTIVNVYTAQKGVWSVTAKITAIVAGCLIAVAGGLFAAYNFWMLEKVRDAHESSYHAEIKGGEA